MGIETWQPEFVKDRDRWFYGRFRIPHFFVPRVFLSKKDETNRLVGGLEHFSPTIVHSNHNTHTKTNYSPTIIWLVVLNMAFLTFHSVGNVIIPTDELIFFRGLGLPPTSRHPSLSGCFSYLYHVEGRVRYWQLVQTDIPDVTIRSILGEHGFCPIWFG